MDKGKCFGRPINVRVIISLKDIMQVFKLTKMFRHNFVL